MAPERLLLHPSTDIRCVVHLARPFQDLVDQSVCRVMRFSRQMNNSQEKQLRQIVQLMETDDSVDAPSDSVTWAKNLYRTRQERPSLIRRLVASLQMDLAPGKAALGERSGSSATARQMLFNAGEHAIDLRVAAENSHVTVQGQVLGDGFAGGEIILSGPGHHLQMTINEESEFQFESVPKGYYNLTLRSSDKEIVIEAVDL